MPDYRRMFENRNGSAKAAVNELFPGFMSYIDEHNIDYWLADKRKIYEHAGEIPYIASVGNGILACYLIFFDDHGKEFGNLMIQLDEEGKINESENPIKLYNGVHPLDFKYQLTAHTNPNGQIIVVRDKYREIVSDRPELVDFSFP